MGTTNLDIIMTNHGINSESSEDLSYLYQDEIKNSKKHQYSHQHKGGEFMSKNIMIRAEQLSSDFVNNSDKPSGGFPPIYILTQKDKDIDKDPSKNRQIAARKTAISIRDILKSKK